MTDVDLDLARIEEAAHAVEYDVEFVVCDIESLVFWLNALGSLHADMEGSAALASAVTLNRILARNVDERGFVTNEHRYLASRNPSRADEPMEHSIGVSVSRGRVGNSFGVSRRGGVRPQP